MDSSDNFHLQKVLTNLLQKALEDGVITEEEKNILKQIKTDFQSFKILIEQVEADGIITEEEKNLIEKFKKKIVRNAYTTSTKDHIITNDERKLISMLVKFFFSKKQQM